MVFWNQFLGRLTSATGLNRQIQQDAGQLAAVSAPSNESLAIEDGRVNRAVVDILEGTLPAFDNRCLKYRKQERGALQKKAAESSK